MIKKIGIDTRMLNNSGIGVTIKGLLDHLSVEQKNHIIPLSKNGPLYSIYSLGQHFFYTNYLNRQNLDLYHMPHFDVPYFYNKPFVMTVHDIIHIKFPQYSSKPFSRLYAKAILKHSVKKAKKIFVVSENTKKDVCELIPEVEKKVRVIYPGVSKLFNPMSNQEAESVLIKYKLKPGYLLYVGNLRPSKNTKNLVSAYKLLKNRLKDCPPLVLVGKSFFKEKIEGDGVVHLDQVPVEDLPSLYSRAKSFLFPSLYEGFGLPVVEAMTCGTAVLVSDRGSLPEISGGAALEVNPNDLNSISSGIEKLLREENFRKELIEKGFKNIKRFSWDQFANETWEEYEKALA